MQCVDGGDATSEAIASEAAFAVIYETVATAGSKASLTAAGRAALAGRLSDDMIGFIQREIAFHARRELDTSWSLGPPRGYFDDIVDGAEHPERHANAVSFGRDTDAVLFEVSRQVGGREVDDADVRRTMAPVARPD